MIEYPLLQKLVTQSFMSFRAHSVLVHKSFKYLNNMLLIEHAIAASKINQEAADFENFIV